MVPRSRGLACRATDLKSPFTYHAALATTAKINFILSVLPDGKTDREQLFRLQGREKLDCAYSSEARIFAPLGQSCEDFIENHYARHNRRIGEVPGQAGMISTDRPG